MISLDTSDRETRGLRPLNPTKDLSQLADLLESAFGAELTGEGMRVLRELRLLGALGPLNVFVSATGSQMNDLFTGFVWIEDNQVAGNVTINRPTGHPRRWQISNVAVLEAYRGQGIARKLVETAIDLALDRGGNVAYLYVNEKNTPARHLYESLGFVEVDRTTDLVLDTPVLDSGKPFVCMRPLWSGEGQYLYELVSETDGVGHRWLYPVRRRQYVVSASKLFSRRIASFLSGEVESRWGVFSGNRLDVGLVFRTTHGLNCRAHRIKLWTRLEQSKTTGQAHLAHQLEQVTQDIFTFLGRKAKRPVHITLPSCKSQMIGLLVQHGFHRRRTLVLMKLDL
jgi:ribosomal protein S18 acetylase RimI-like enzyme